MSKCSHCGNDKLLFKKGEKNGRPWKGLKCLVCEKMTWLPDNSYCIEEQEYDKRGGDMTKDEWRLKENRDHRRRIMLALISNYPDLQVQQLHEKADEVMRYVQEEREY